MCPSSGSALPPDTGVLIAAGGMGERMGPGIPKQFRPIRGVPMLLRAVRPFAQHPRVKEIVVALPEDAAAAPPSWLRDVAGERLRIVAGGRTRADSVYAAMSVLDAACAIVLVHDAARPFVTVETIDAVIERAAAGVAAVPAVRVGDTLKRVKPGTARVLETVDRSDLWRAQTPQGFPRTVLESAFASVKPAARAAYTDEAALIESTGGRVEIVPDRVGNLKVTTEEDFLLAEYLVAP
ncbi:MAG: 2-C-methyl-D-erythritol 4-phosphate cytidylyltransferase [Gemmatimonadota bacterium]|nr:2-C-methyl-D-erythritol 4-phosphate cytidylyltransferase [Gemmatimonadota bacterium]MDH3368319.1 2-C-methyl-D-erythritol 4-phosphate cytidylyltransferase [Gemmatimonadota bacterium]MDH3479520.1 2-C-methyl-D-erythritol 4-phosphate cytidylyltransferase [Gemmatimonadota bacterium]MDH5549618.1 2-C-methyl-D-erythritol 4-phosphate cytidylyltransferase [Gemmatimonadota bacterium]